MNAWSDENIIFIFSLPRSGSTLVQRILTGHPQVASISESWLLLPQFYALRPHSVFAEYAHISASNAIQEFYRHLPNGYSDYLNAVKTLSVSLFSKISSKQPSVTHFVEKTPRNTLVIDEIIETFPKSKFVFLWRNPLAIAASMIETFGLGKWNLYKTKIDLFQGLENMVMAYGNIKSRAFTINYEDLIERPEQICKQMFDYLNLPFNTRILSQFSSVEFQGRMGDQTGTNEYEAINSAPLLKWRTVLNNPIRRLWAEKYLDWIGAERLHRMGYDKKILMGELQSIPYRLNSFVSDICRITYGFCECFLETKIFFTKFRKYKGMPYVVRHF